MKEKIKAALVNKYKNLGFSDKAIEGVLAYLETTVTDEAGIEGAVNGVEGMLKAFQSEVDTRVTAAVNKPKPPTPAPAANPTEGPATQEPVTPPADAPEWMRGFMTTMQASVQTLATELQTIKAGKSTETRKTQLEEVLKNTPDSFKSTIMKAFDRMKFEKDEEFTSYLEEIKTDSAAFVQDTANSGLSSSRPPIVPSGGNNPQQATADQAAAVLKNM
jgi:hypothetical protein